MARQIDSPFPIFTDVDGSPLEGGYIFIGEPNLDPLTNPKQAYWDEGLTEPANNIRTKSGYPVNGTFPSRLFIPDGDYSILIQNKREITVYSSVTAPEIGTNITTGAQTFFGVKTFDSIPIVPSNPIESGDTGAVRGGDVYTYVTNYVPTYAEPIWTAPTITTINDASDVPITLPDPSTSSGDFTYVRKGTGTGKLTLNCPSGVFLDFGDDLLSSVDLEGNGTLIVTPSGGNLLVKEYRDSGSNSNGEWKKYLDGMQECWDKLGTKNNGDIVLFPKSFYATPVMNLVATGNCATFNINSASTSQFTCFITSSTGAVTSDPADYVARGRWRA